MKRSLISIMMFGIVVCLLTFAGTGCARYLDEDTPAAQAMSPGREVAPVGGVAGVGGLIAGTDRMSAAESSMSPYIGKPLSGAVQPMTEAVYAASIGEFKQGYTKAESPRIAVYFNKSLSDEVREWVTASRDVMSGKGEKVSVGESGATIVTPGGVVVETGSETTAEGSDDTERGVTTYTQRHLEELRRRNPEEIWMWRFEDNFLQPLLKGGAKIVDRATILRLVAAASGKQGDAYSPVAVKKMEMDALSEYADIFVEILVTRDHTSPSGYAFKASAKETKTGIVVGSVAKTGRDYRYEKSYEAVTTSSGYKIRRGSAALVLENVSQELAVDLMNSLVNTWNMRTP